MKITKETKERMDNMLETAIICWAFGLQQKSSLYMKFYMYYFDLYRLEEKE